jgi:hypothetical protein
MTGKVRIPKFSWEDKMASSTSIAELQRKNKTFTETNTSIPNWNLVSVHYFLSVDFGDPAWKKHPFGLKTDRIQI